MSQAIAILGPLLKRADFARQRQAFAAMQSPHVRHRRFTDWVAAHAPAWGLIRHVPNPYPDTSGDPSQGTFADFFFFEKHPI